MLVNAPASGSASMPACSGDWPSPACSSSVSTNMKLPKKKTRPKFTAKPGRERAVAEQRQVEQGLTAAPGQPPLPGHGQGQHREGRRQRGPGPRRPALVAAERQRHQRQGQARRDAERAEPVEAGPALRPRVRHHDGGGDQAAMPTGTFTRKIARQPRPEDVGLDQRAAEDLPGHEAEPHGHAEPGQGAAALSGPGMPR